MICITMTLHQCPYALSLGKQHHTMLRGHGNAEKFWLVARRCATGNQLAAISNIRWRTGSPFVALFGPVYVVPCGTFTALKMFDAFLEASRMFCCIRYKSLLPACHSTGVMEKHCENISNV